MEIHHHNITFNKHISRRYILALIKKYIKEVFKIDMFLSILNGKRSLQLEIKSRIYRPLELDLNTYVIHQPFTKKKETFELKLTKKDKIYFENLKKHIDSLNLMELNIIDLTNMFPKVDNNSKKKKYIFIVKFD